MSYPCPELDADELWLDELHDRQNVFPSLEDSFDEEDRVKEMHAHPNTPAECWYGEDMSDSVPSLSATVSLSFRPHVCPHVSYAVTTVMPLNSRSHNTCLPPYLTP
ncbi:hypothetical protein IAT38_005688 [Cryptococcus sp. DSM 104549]